MQYPQLLVYALNFAVQYKYPLVFLGTIIEGPIVMIASGFFYHQGDFAFFPLYAALVVGDLVADVAWYYLGYYFAEPFIRRYGKHVGVTEEVFQKIKHVMNKHQTYILLGSKLTLGLGFALATVITAGATKVPLKRFILLNALGEFFLTLILLSVGYFFGRLYVYIADSFKIAFLIGGLLLGGIAVYGLSSYVKERTLKI